MRGGVCKYGEMTVRGSLQALLMGDAKQNGGNCSKNNAKDEGVLKDMTGGFHLLYAL